MFDKWYRKLYHTSLILFCKYLLYFYFIQFTLHILVALFRSTKVNTRSFWNSFFHYVFFFSGLCNLVFVDLITIHLYHICIFVTITTYCWDSSFADLILLVNSLAYIRTRWNVIDLYNLKYNEPSSVFTWNGNPFFSHAI